MDNEILQILLNYLLLVDYQILIFHLN